MNKPSGFDDLAGLMSETDLNPATYKTFSQPSFKKIDVLAEQCDQTAAETRVEPPKIRPFAAPPSRENLIADPIAADVSFASETTRKNLTLLSSWTSWSGLDLVFGEVRPGSSEPDIARLDSGRNCSFVIAGISGGVGATSVVTGLARLCSKGGRRALLLDPNASSVLPLYFGSRSTRLQLSRFVLPGDARGGAIHICQRADSYSADPAANWARAIIESLARDTDSLFVDAGQAEGNRLLNELGGAAIRIIILTPETRCLAKLADLEEEWRNSQAPTGAAKPLLLLSQFDPAEPLHQEIRMRLERRFSDRLIPIVIRHSREVSVALAEGCTVFDYAPQALAAADLRALYRWLEDQHPIPANAAFNYKVQAL
jgi:cellulose biosynthesis protein BcsQ